MCEQSVLKLAEACREEQFAAMSRIHSLGWRDTYPGYVPDDYLRDVCTEDHWTAAFQESCETGNGRGLLLYADDIPAGCIHFGPARTKNAVGCENYGEIFSFYMHPDYRGRGYGGRLMDAALKQLKQDGHDHAFVLVLRENEGARRFYEGCGFSWDKTVIDIPFPHNYICADLRYVRSI